MEEAVSQVASDGPGKLYLNWVVNMKVTLNSSVPGALSQIRVENVRKRKKILGIVVIRRPQRFLYVPYVVFPWSFIYLEKTETLCSIYPQLSIYISIVFHISRKERNKIT